MSAAPPSGAGQPPPPTAEELALQRQRFVMQREEIRKWPEQDKLRKVAPWFPCSCGNCQGFKNMAKAPDGSSYYSPNTGVCTEAACQHDTASHGNLLALPDGELDRRCLIIVAMEHLHKQSKTKPREQQIQFQQKIQIYREKLYEVPRGSDRPALGEPPFERPVIAQILKNFLDLKYSSESVAYSHQYVDTIGKLCKTFLQNVNAQDLPTPEQYKVSNPKDGSFGLNYNRWLVYCRGQHQGPLQGQRNSPSDVFGRSYLLSVFKLAENNMRQSPTLAPFEAIVDQFFKALEAEIINPRSPIFSVDGGAAAGIPSGASAAGAAAAAAAAAARRGVVVTSSRITGSGTIQAGAPGGRTFAQPGAGVQRVGGSSGPSGSGPMGGGGGSTVTPRAAMRGAGGYGGDGQFVSMAQVELRSEAEPMSGPVAIPSAMGLASRYGEGIRALWEATRAASGVGADAGAAEPMDTGANVTQQTGFGVVRARDEVARIEEQTGMLRFESVHNDSKPQSVLWLTQVKGVFSKGLPRMPVDYIARLVYDHHHHSLCLIKGTRVIGGILYRPFTAQGFAEIVFLAIDPSEQVKGYGTHIMNHLKEVCKLLGIYNLLTCADNFATGYFAKQGFSDHLTLPKARYVGYIKDYDGSTLMECRFEPKIDYLRIPLFIQAARARLDEALRLRCANYVVHPGLTAFRDAAPKFVRLAIESIPGVAGTQYSKDESLLDEDTLHKRLVRVLAAVREHTKAELFDVAGPLPEDRTPIDLTMIQARLDSRRFYITKDLFVADLTRMFANARFEEDTELYRASNMVEQLFKVQLMNADLGAK